MDASAEFQVYLSPSSKWRDRTQGIRQRLVPVITNMVPTNGFSLNHRSPNIYKAVSGVSFQDTDLGGRKKKKSKKEQLGDKKSESEPSIFRSKKEHFAISQLYKKKESTDETNHKRSNSTKRKPSFEFRHKDLSTIPINSNMEPNKIARTSSKKERSRSTSQIRNPMPLGDRTNSFEFPIRPRRARSSSRSRNSTGQNDYQSSENKSKRKNSTGRQYCSFTPWKNIDVIRNVEDLRIHTDISDNTNIAQTKVEDHNFILKKPDDETEDHTEKDQQNIHYNKLSDLQISTKEIQINNDNVTSVKDSHDFSSNDILLYDNVRFGSYEDSYEADSSSEVIYISQSVEVNSSYMISSSLSNSSSSSCVKKVTTSTHIVQSPEEHIYDSINIPITNDSLENSYPINDHSNVNTNNSNVMPQIIKISSDKSKPLNRDEQMNSSPPRNEISVVNIVNSQNNVQIQQDDVPNHHNLLINKLSNSSVLSKDSSDYDYVTDFQVNLDLSEDEDFTSYSTFIPSSEVEDSYDLKPFIPRAQLSNNGEQSMRLRVNGQFVDLTKSTDEKPDKVSSSELRLLPLNPILRLSSQNNSKEPSELRRHSWLNSFVSKDQFEKDQKNERWSFNNNVYIDSEENKKTSPSTPPKYDKASNDNSQSSVYTDSITFDDDDQETNSSYPEPLYEPIYVKPINERLKIPRVNSNGITPPKTFKDFLENKCFNPPDSDSEAISNDRYSDHENFYCDLKDDSLSCKKNGKVCLNNVPKGHLVAQKDIGSWQETSSEFEFVDMRDELDERTEIRTSNSTFYVRVPIDCVDHFSSDKSHKNKEEYSDLVPYPTLASLPAPYTPHVLPPSSSGITL